MSNGKPLLTSDELLDILALSKDATAIYTSENIIIQAANDTMIGFWGKDRSVIGMSFEEAIPELKNQPFLGYLKDVWRTGITYSAVNTAATLKVDGKLQTFYFDFEYRAIKNNDGKMYCILHTATDVTERVLAVQREDILNKELAATSEELAATNEELLTSIEELRLSQEQLQNFNEKLEDLVATRTTELAATNEELSAANEELVSGNEELQQSQAELQATYNELEKTTDILNQAIETAVIGTWNVALPSTELSMSERAFLIHGITDPANTTLPDILALIEPTHRERVTEVIRNAITNVYPFEEEYIIFPKDGGKRKWIRATGKAYYDKQGNGLNVSGTMLDITERKEDEQRKNDFIAMVSHELKTPLTSLKGYVQLLHIKALKDGDDFRIKTLARAEIQANKMTAMINGFLNISRLDAGKIDLVKQEFSLYGLIGEIIEEVSVVNSQYAFKFNYSENFTISADREKIGYVINNLLSNAVKYSRPNTPIEIQCGLEGNMALVSVNDKGVGIQPHEKDRIFHRFYRTENPISQQVSGFGIGLYLSAEIIKQHDGKIWVDSEPGKGSTFHFSLPVS